MFFKKKPRTVAPIVHANDTDFDRLVAEHPGVVLVDFWAPWCGPCRLMEGILSEIATEYEPDGVLVVKVNVDDARGTAADFDVRSIPNLMFFRDGEPLFEMVGAVPKPVIARELDELLDPPNGETPGA